MAEKLKIISLGGLNEIGKNLTVYEYGGDIIVVDVGMGFPDDDMYGIDVVIPDFTYLIKNKDKIRGIFLTHGHEDHIGSLPYLLRDVNAPIYATRMTAGLVKLKLEEHRLLDKTKLITCEAGEVVKAGKFTVEFIHVNHSIADAVAFAIKCPVGTVRPHRRLQDRPHPHPGRHDGPGPAGPAGQGGGAGPAVPTPPTWSAPATPSSERSVGDSFDALFRGCEERIIVTTFASNVDRIQQIIDVAARYGRKVAVTGRSMENAMKVSTELGYMNIPDGVLVDLNHIKTLPKNKVCIITTGSQGETMSALYPHGLLHPPAGGHPGRGPGDHLRLRHPGQRELHRQRDQRALPQGGRGGQRAGWRPPRVGPRLPGGAEDHPRPGQAQVLHPRPRGAAASADPRQAGPGDGHGPPRTSSSATSAG